MKTSRLLALFLATVMLIGSAVLLSSCAKKNGSVKLGSKQVALDLLDYGVVYADEIGEYSMSFRNYMAQFVEELGSATGQKLIAYSEERAKTEAGDKEILIGATKREESEKALASIKGEGFAIRVTENKLVIVGSSPLFTLQAMSYFAQNYLTPDHVSGEALSVHERITLKNAETLLLATEEESYFNYVYADGLYEKDPKGLPWDPVDNDYCDYPVQAANELAEAAAGAVALRASKFALQKDSEKSTSAEVLVGMVDREECRSVLSTLRESEYGICVQNGKLVITGWNDLALESATLLFKGLLADAKSIDEEGKVRLCIPATLSLKGKVDTSWITDFPRPDALSLVNTLDVQDGALEFLYTGDQISDKSFDEYLEKLKGEGYGKLSENSIEGSKFATLSNKKTNTYLYVAYNAYTHAGEYVQDFDAEYFEKCLRIVSAPLDTVTLPDAGLLTPNPSYEKKTDASITSVDLMSSNSAESYVVMLEDGRFVIIDGGGGDQQRAQTVLLWDVLCDLHTKAWGAAPTTQQPVHIAAWLITHAHNDHFNVCRELMRSYGKNGLLKIDYFLANFPSRTETFPVYSGGNDISLEDVKGLQGSVLGGFKYVKPHTGDVFYLANLKIEILATHEDLNPHRLNYFNDSSTVFRFDIKPTGGESVTSIWTGDAYYKQSRNLCAMYGSYLQSDMVQISHHGYNGLEAAFYQSVAATTVWFPGTLPGYKYHSDPAKKDRDWPFSANYAALHAAHTKYVFVSDLHNTTLYLRAAGPDYDNLYDAFYHSDLNSQASEAIIKK